MSLLPDSYIRPSARCVICTVPFDEHEQVALVTGTDDDHYEWTRVFGFPAAIATLDCTVFSRTVKQRRRKLCYNPFQSSSGSTFHLHCFWESKDPGIGPVLHLEHIWRFSLWTRPLEIAPSLDDFEASQPVPYEPTEDELRRACANNDLLWRLGKLPLEIKQDIMTMAYGSLLWRIFAARKWREMLRPVAGESVIRSLINVKSWKRSGNPNPNLKGDIMSITIDNLGIRSLEVSKSWPSSTSHQATNHKVYIVEQMSDLCGLFLEEQGGYGRFQKVNKPLRLWDTPTPPRFRCCQFKDKQISPLRLKTIRLNTSLHGLSVFCCDGATYGIYPHYSSNQSSVLDIFRQIPLSRRKTLVWLFCPLVQQEIKNVWLRHDPNLVFPAVLVLRTARDQVYTFGPYRNSGCSNQHLGMSPSHIVFESVPLGEGIPAIGIATEVSPEPCDAPQSYFLSSLLSDIEGLYCCSALLENIQWVTSYCIEGYCVGIMINYSCGLQQALGQCRPDAERQEVDNPIGFHHLSQVVGRQRTEMVHLSTNRQEYEALAKSGWESAEVNVEPTWLFLGCNDTTNLCSLVTQPSLNS